VETLDFERDNADEILLGLEKIIKKQ